MDLWDLENDVNMGDGTDLWSAPEYTTLTPTTLPNSNWWSGSQSGLVITGVSNSSDLMTYHFLPSPPRISFAPSSLAFTVNYAGQACEDLDITNDGGLYLTWLVAEYDAKILLENGLQLPGSNATTPRENAVSRGTGGPDAYGYRWMDSDEVNGPTFSWHDITVEGWQEILENDDFRSDLIFPGTFPFTGLTIAKCRSTLMDI